MSALASPQPVGTVVGLTAIAKEEGNWQKVIQKLRYRYSISVDGSPFRIVRDFSRQPNFAWRPELYEHTARVKVTVENVSTHQAGEAELPFRIISRVTTQKPVVTPTANPLVALFSFSACPDGSHFRVAFQRQGEPDPLRTGVEPCQSSRSSNIYVAGMRADSDYQLHAEVLSARSVQSGPSVSFHAGVTDGLFPSATVAVKPGAEADKAEPFLIHSVEEPVQRAIATDLEGNVVWYLPLHERSLTRMLSGGRFLVFSGGLNEENSRMQVLSEVDLAGNTLQETNIERLAQQLEERGIHSVCKPNGQQCVSGFHHDAIRLPNGHTMAIASLERMFPAGGQGSEDPVDVIGVLLLDLDEQFQLKWFWNAFDHLDTKRASLGAEKCRGPVGGGGCAATFLAPVANDWLHGNAVAYSGADHNLLLSLPEQDWIVKINYGDGKGDGKVLWRLGEGGDLTVQSSDQHPWFSFQHDVGFDPAGPDALVLLDNGQRRHKYDFNARTRGQLWRIDEKAHTATLVMAADLGVYSPWVGSAQRLSNGNFHFTTGAIRNDTAFSARSIEIDASGKPVYALETNGVLLYRSNRIADMYTPPAR